jgi:ribonucleoside-diphosphate reductase alpha chain
MNNDWSTTARRLLQARYLRRDATGTVTETADELFWRVSNAIADGDATAGLGLGCDDSAERFQHAMTDRVFLPSSPVLFNAGTDLGQLMACFVLPIPDSLDGIFTTLRDAAIIQHGGGGTGFSFSALRPRGDIVRSTGRPSSGAVSFTRVFDVMTDVISGESVRGGANMGVLRIDHPDIREFVSIKRDLGALTHFNLSVGVTDEFMLSAREGGQLTLINPRNGAPAGTVAAAALLDEIAAAALESGDPGMLFLDRIERDNPTPSLGQLEATNPCGEAPLLPYEACCLGSINLSALVRDQSANAVLDENLLRRMVRLGVHFLDDVIEVSRYPRAEIERLCHANRKIGLGVMGLADLLLALRIPYGSADAVRLVDHVMNIIQGEAIAASQELATLRGPFSNFAISRYAGIGQEPRRNATLTTVAPTGSLSIIAGCSSGIEPLYALAYERTGTIVEQFGMHQQVLRILEEAGLARPDILREIEITGRAGHITELPQTVRYLLRTAAEIPVAEHLAVQAATQRHVENAVSKTIILPPEATVEDVREAFIGAWRLGCKGVTIYREGSRSDQALHVLGHCLACVGEELVPVS